MKNSKKHMLLGAALCLVIAGVCVGVGITMRGQYPLWWLFAAGGVLFSVLLYVFGLSLLHYAERLNEREDDGDTTPPAEPDEGLLRLHSMGLHISEEEYRKMREKIAEENKDE